MIPRLHTGDTLTNGLDLTIISVRYGIFDIPVMIVYNSTTLVAQDDWEITLGQRRQTIADLVSMTTTNFRILSTTCILVARRSRSIHPSSIDCDHATTYVWQIPVSSVRVIILGHSRYLDPVTYRGCGYEPRPVLAVRPQRPRLLVAHWPPKRRQLCR
jgi:hypothetical protein